MIKIVLLNWLVINSVLVADDNVPYVCRALPAPSIKQKRSRWVVGSLEDQEYEEVLEERMNRC